MKMKRKDWQKICSGLVAMSFAFGVAGGAEAAPQAELAGAAGQVVAAEAESGQGKAYESQGFSLRIPTAYEDKLLIETSLEQEGRFFAVYEKASVEAAQKAGYENIGAGWLFSLGRVTEEELHKLLCGNMSGAQLFAKDNEGGYYIYYHPTDVRYMRGSQEEMVRDQTQWTELTAWASKEVRSSFIRDNGLESFTADNSNIGLYLANFLYGPGEAYTLGKDGEPPLMARGFAPLPYVEKLLYGASYRSARDTPMRKFHYFTLVLPREKVRLDFFTGKDGENYVQEVHEGWTNYLYRGTFEDKNFKAVNVMAKWLEDLKASQKQAEEEAAAAAQQENS